MRRIVLTIMVGIVGAAASVPALAQLTEGERAAALLTRYRVIPSITYTTQSNTDLKLDLYLPPREQGTPPVPVLIEIHGGGWIAGTKEGSQLEVLPYLEMGYAAVNVEYRLAKSALAPAAVEDCRCALRWVLRNAKQYNLDTNRIVLTGGSAGGHLALITGMLPASAGLDRECTTAGDTGWSDAGSQGEMKVAAIVNWFGITDVPAMLEGPETHGYAVEWFASLANRDEIAKRVSPMTYVRSGLPPVLTIHGDKDTLVPYAQAERLHAALSQAGVPNRLFTIPGGGHGGFTAEQQTAAFVAIKEFLAARVK
jgi:acetyl esterase/lipase